MIPDIRRRARVRKHAAGIAVAAGVVAMAVGHLGDSLFGLVSGCSVAAYAVGFAMAVRGRGRSESVAIAIVLGAVGAVVVTASYIPFSSAADVVLHAALLSAAILSSGWSSIGFRDGAALHNEPPPLLSPMPVLPMRMARPRPAQRARRRPLRVEVPLDDVPESFRSVVFAMRLKRRQLGPRGNHDDAAASLAR